MKWVDAVARRLGYVPQQMRLRAWKAAKQDRFTAGWLTSSEPINRQISAGLSVLQARSREQAQNNDFLKRFLQLTQANVVGHKGIILQAKSKDPDGRLDKRANDAIESAWRDWGRFGNCDNTGRHSWRSFQQLWIRLAAMDGETFVYLDRDTNVNKYGLALRMFDPADVDATVNIDRIGAGTRVINGVEVNADDRPLAYLLKGMTSPNYSYRGKKYKRIPADDVLHSFLPEWVYGVRGIPWVAQSLLKMGMLDGMMEAELVASRAGASKMGFFYEEDSGKYTGDAETEGGDLLTNVEPGTFERLPGGVKFQEYDPKHPTDAFEPFVKTSLRGIAAGLGVSYNALANDLEGVNYSSLRSGAIDDRALWMLLQEWMVESFVDRVYRAWLKNSLDRGVIQVFGRPLYADRYEKFTDVAWQPRRWQWVDPVKDIQAAEKSIELGIKSRSDVIREQGRDPEDVWQEIADERARMRELKIMSVEGQS